MEFKFICSIKSWRSVEHVIVAETILVEPDLAEIIEFDCNGWWRRIPVCFRARIAAVDFSNLFPETSSVEKSFGVLNSKHVQ